MAEDNAHPQGKVVRVIGPVVDVEFPPSELPDIYTALKVDVTLENANGRGCQCNWSHAAGIASSCSARQQCG